MVKGYLGSKENPCPKHRLLAVSRGCLGHLKTLPQTSPQIVGRVAIKERNNKDRIRKTRIEKHTREREAVSLTTKTQTIAVAK